MFVGVVVRLLDVSGVLMTLVIALSYALSSGVCVLSVSAVCSLGGCDGVLTLVMMFERKLKAVSTFSVRGEDVSVPLMVSCGPTLDPASSVMTQSSSCCLLALINP